MPPFVRTTNISKRFHNTQALNNVSADFERGEIHVIIGENGAGKSTLMKIVAGLYRQDSGDVILDGTLVSFASPRDAIQHKIAMIHQELLPIPDLTIAQNIYLGREPRTVLGTIDHGKINRDTQTLFDMMGIRLNPKQVMRKLSTAQVQLVEIAKAVSFNSELLIMDEPTSALSDKEIDNLYSLIFKLKAEGAAVVFISEILGISGLMGAGRTELVESIFGLRRPDSGKIFVHGREVRIREPHDAQEVGIALIPEDRKLLGLNLKASTGFNISICNIRKYVRKKRVSRRLENAAVDTMIANLGIKVPSRNSPVVSLSGGNQQKVVLAKWLMTIPGILIMDEPTRGIDIGAKTEIYRLIVSMAQQGKSIIMVSSELPEIMGLSDRVLVLCEGRLRGVLRGDQINQHDIMRCATNQLELV